MSPTKRTEIKRFMRRQPRPALELSLLLSDVEDPVNVGSACRIADACGAKELLLTGITPRPPHKLITKVGRGKDRRVPWRYIEDATIALTTLRDDGVHLVALEITEDAKPYFEVSYPSKTCFLVGHEEFGVHKKLLTQAHETVFIPIYGKGASLNVHTALGIVAFHALQASIPDAIDKRRSCE